MSSVSLASINIEGHKHLKKRVLPFLVAQQPDVVCLQEVFAVDLALLEQELGLQAWFLPLTDVQTVSIHQTEALGPIGIAILTQLPVIQSWSPLYVGSHDRLPVFLENDNPNSTNRGLIALAMQHESQTYHIATTHFTWSPAGSTTNEQRQHLIQLEKTLATLPEHVLCGDFNAPRGGEVFARLSQLYHDNIPPEYTTSIDGSLHKAGPLELMVDGLFSQPAYSITQVKLHTGVSDHCAITAQITIRPKL